MLELTLYFDNECDVQVISEQIGITSAQFKSKKEQRKSPNRDDNLEGFWRCSTEYIETLEFEDVSSQLLRTIAPFLEKIQYARKKYEGQARLDIVVEVGKIKPSLYLDREFLVLVEQLEADIDIDMYVG